MGQGKLHKPREDAEAAPGATAEEREYRRSAVEVDHRIANNLAMVVSLVRLHASRLARERRAMSTAEASTLLYDVASRIETVARLHRLLSRTPDGPEGDLGTYLQELCDTLAESLPFAGAIAFSSSVDSRCAVSPAEVLPLALIVTEAVTNAVKYAHPTGLTATVAVSCRRDDGGALVVEITDDGVGLPEGFDPEADGDLGFHAMRLLARQIGAKLSFDSSPLGLRVTVRMPPDA